MIDRISINPFKKIPPHVSVELTHLCNFRCPFCYASCGRSKKHLRGEMSSSEWMRAIDSFLVRGAKTITLSGGEPLMKEGFEDILEYVSSHPSKPKVGVYTNASLITKRHIKQFKRLGVRVIFSLQGLETFKHHTRGGSDVFDVLGNIMKIRDAGLRIACGITVTKRNRYELRNMVSAAVLAGAKDVQVVPIVAEGRAIGKSDLLLDYSEMTDLLTRETDSLQKLTDSRITGRAELFCSCVSNAIRPVGLPSDYVIPQCESENDMIMIDPSGNIHKCLHTPESLGYWSDFMENFPLCELDNKCK